VTLDAVDTPALVIDHAVLRANVERMARLAREAGVALRPHAKTHKMPEVARLQLAAGAVGLTVAKLGEAEVFADAGVADLFVAYPIVGPAKIARLVALAGREGMRVSVAVDAAATAEAIGRAAATAGVEIGVRVEVDTGMHRLGVPSGAEAAALAVAVTGMAGLRFEGVMTHEGHAYQAAGPAELEERARAACDALVAAAEAVRAAGVACEVVSMGSSATARFAIGHPGVTEVRPGTYVFNDRSQVAHGAAARGDVAATVLATVVSRPSAGIAAVDAGTKALTADRLIVPDAHADFGAVAGTGWPVKRASEEHGLVAVPRGVDVGVGDRLAIVPNHICPVVNLFDAVTVVEDGAIVDSWTVAARGRMT
jgi:D-serine deaminase-like pyridoxal phosphate-dependent protein